jgi:hypothetical protein
MRKSNESSGTGDDHPNALRSLDSAENLSGRLNPTIRKASLCQMKEFIVRGAIEEPPPMHSQPEGSWKALAILTEAEGSCSREWTV